jgi:hypothetical protein
LKRFAAHCTARLGATLQHSNDRVSDLLACQELNRSK